MYKKWDLMIYFVNGLRVYIVYMLDMFSLIHWEGGGQIQLWGF